MIKVLLVLTFESTLSFVYIKKKHKIKINNNYFIYKRHI